MDNSTKAKNVFKSGLTVILFDNLQMVSPVTPASKSDESAVTLIFKDGQSFNVAGPEAATQRIVDAFYSYLMERNNAADGFMQAIQAHK
jgi:hypothetical protein